MSSDRDQRPGSEEPTIPPAKPSTELPTEALHGQLDSQEAPTVSRAEADTAFPKTDTPALGTKVRYFGDYELLEEIARGGMGVVYKARQVSLNRIVALKMILAGQLASDEDVQRFHTEAEAAAKLDHPGIVPIFEVGEHEGQHYFSMGFVDGPSLAEKLSQGPLPPKEAAELTEALAQAIAYAHQQGVIHRDLKPANVLLARSPVVSDQIQEPTRQSDASGSKSSRLSTLDSRPRITDFGLAKKMEADSNLTGTGQILGTPSFMPPEQAAGKTHEIGPAADVYALGAVLYTMLSGRPPFQAANPVDTLLQVLDKEPVAPRQLDSGIARDLETICVKCLEKSPPSRYASAGELADDLRRFLNNDPIRARPIGTLEHVSRWLHRQRRSVLLAANAVVATLSIGVCLLLVWNMVARMQRSYLNLSTDSMPLVAEIFDEQDRPANSPRPVPGVEPVQLPAGNYKIKFSRSERFSQSYWTTLSQGRVAQLDVNLEDQVLWESSDVPESYTLVKFADGVDVAVLRQQGISRRDGASGKTLWLLDFDKTSADAVFSVLPGWRWSWRIGDEERRLRPQLLSQAIDLNGDGAEDMICAGRHQAWLMAVSGSDGKLLWVVGRGSDLREEGLSPNSVEQIRSSIHGPPVMAEDIDGDLVADLLITYADKTLDEQITWNVEAVSGSSGKKLWHYELLEGAFPDLRRAMEPDNLLSISEDGRDHVHEFLGANDRHIYRRPSAITPIPNHCVLPARITSSGDETFAILAVAGEPIVLNARTGKRAASAERVARVAGGLAVPWSRPFAGVEPTQHWPVVADLDGDGRDEKIFPEAGSSHGSDGDSIDQDSPIPWGALAVRDADGMTRWSRKLISMDQWIDRFLVGPDINDDGHREIFTATLCGVNFDLYIDALSGSDGSSLWTSRERLVASSDPARNEDSTAYSLGPLRWWHAGSDGWPQLIVTLRRNDREQWLAYMYAAHSGRSTRSATGLRWLQPADVDNDGADELFAYHPGSRGSGTMFVFCGLGVDRWRWLDSSGQPVVDLNQDGTHDLIYGLSDEVHARSGRTGRMLWRRRKPISQSFGSRVVRSAVRVVRDLDGDDISDILRHGWETRQDPAFAGRSLEVWRPYETFSGRTGEVLRLDWYVLSFGGPSYEEPLFELRDLEGDGQTEVVMVAVSNWDDEYGRIRKGQNAEIWLEVYDVRDRRGRHRWRQPLTARYGSTEVGGGDAVDSEFPYVLDDGTYPIGYADLDADGTLDVVVPAESTDTPGELQWRAYSGRSGSELWHTSLSSGFPRADSLRNIAPPLLVDLDLDRRPEIIVLEFDKAETDTRRTARLRALTAEGEEMWRWERVINWKWRLESFGREAAKPSSPTTRVASQGRSTANLSQPLGQSGSACAD